MELDFLLLLSLWIFIYLEIIKICSGNLLITNYCVLILLASFLKLTLQNLSIFSGVEPELNSILDIWRGHAIYLMVLGPHEVSEQVYGQRKHYCGVLLGGDRVQSLQQKVGFRKCEDELWSWKLLRKLWPGRTRPLGVSWSRNTYLTAGGR